MDSVRKTQNVPNPLSRSADGLSEKSRKCAKPTEALRRWDSVGKVGKAQNPLSRGAQASVRKAENVPNSLRANGISLSEKSGKCEKTTEAEHGWTQ